MTSSQQHRTAPQIRRHPFVQQSRAPSYPPDAFGGGVNLWWQLSHWPGTRRRIGDEPKIAAWLAFNKSPGDRFTTDELRNAIGDRLSATSRNNREHFQRRIRELRSECDGWIFPSAKHDKGLDVGDYKLERIGWHPAVGPRPKDKTAISAKTRRRVLERDNYRCFHCGVRAGESYPGRPNRTAVITVGHVIPRDRGGSGHESNLRAECALCNEAARSDTRVPEDFTVLRISIDNLKSVDRTRLLEWITASQRIRDRVDEAYDRYRQLSPADQKLMQEHLTATTVAARAR